LAGIGFELRRLMRRNSFWGLLRAYGYAGMISSGPWVLSILGVMGIGIFSASRVNSLAVRQFLVTVTYLMAGSLILTGFLQLMFTRFIADRLFAKEESTVLPNLFGALALTTVVGPAVAAGSAAVTVAPVSYWQAKFDRVAAGDAATNLPLSRSSDSWDFYNLAYSIDANVSLFEATGATRYLDQAITYASNMVATARPSTSLGSKAEQDGYLGWISQRSDVAGTEVPLFESYAWRYVARLLRVMHDTPTVYAAPGHSPSGAG